MCNSSNAILFSLACPLVGLCCCPVIQLSLVRNSYISLYTHLDLRNTTLGLSFHFQHRNTWTLPRQSPARDNRCTMVRAEYASSTRSSNHISYSGNPQIQHPIQGSPLHTHQQPHSSLHGTIRPQATETTSIHRFVHRISRVNVVLDIVVLVM
jgi:hypothetical protein